MTDLDHTLTFLELSKIYNTERQTEKLQPLPVNFRQAIKAAFEAYGTSKRHAGDIDQILAINDEMREYKLMITGIVNKRYLKIIDIASMDAIGGLYAVGPGYPVNSMSGPEKQAYDVLRAAIIEAIGLIDPGGFLK